MRAVAISVILSLALACEAETAPRTCNGHEELCDRRFDEVTLLGAHNSMSTRPDGFLAPNQGATFPQQLRLGARAFLIDTFDTPEGVALCHTACVYGSTPISEMFAQLSSFLDENPHDVVAVLVEDAASAETFASEVEAAGLLSKVFVHESAAPLPTLGELADADTRIFISAQSGGPPPAWYHPMWDSYFDTPYDFDTTAALAAAPSCDVNRGDAGNALFLINHFVGNPFPDAAVAAEVNAAAVLRERVNRCASDREHVPNVVAVDFVDEGDAAQIVDELNGVSRVE